MPGIIGTQIFYNTEAYDLACWAVDEFYQNNNKPKALKLKRMADRMEKEFRERDIWYENKPEQFIGLYLKSKYKNK